MTGHLDLDRPVVRHAIAAAFAVLALALRWCSLDSQELWFDEALTAHIAWAPNGLDFVHNTPPLYFVLVRAWADLFGIDAIGLRSFSVVTGVLFVWIAPLVARDLFGNRAALPTAIVALLLPIHLYYSQEARAYSLLVLELLLALWLLWRLKRRYRIATLVGLVLCSAAALYTHYLAAIPLAIAWCVIGLPGRVSGGAGPRSILAAGVVTVLLVLPWVLWWSQHTAFRPEDMTWLAALWESLPGPSAMYVSLELFGIGAQEGHAPIALKQWTYLAFPDWLRIGTLAGLGGLLLFALLRLAGEERGARRGALQAVAMLCGPLLLLWLLSFLKPAYCPGRYDLIALPGFVLLVGYAASRITRQAGSGGKVLAILLTGIVVLGWGTKNALALAADGGTSRHARLADHIASQATHEETVILPGSAGLHLLAYWYRDDWIWMQGRCSQPKTGKSFGCRLLPTSLESAPAAVMRYVRMLNEGNLTSDLQELLTQSAETRGVYLVLPDELRRAWDNGPVLKARVERALRSEGFEFAAVHRFGEDEDEMRVRHYVKAR